MCNSRRTELQHRSVGCAMDRFLLLLSADCPSLTSSPFLFLLRSIDPSCPSIRSTDPCNDTAGVTLTKHLTLFHVHSAAKKEREKDADDETSSSSQMGIRSLERSRAISVFSQSSLLVRQVGEGRAPPAGAPSMQPVVTHPVPARCFLSNVDRRLSGA